MDDDAGCHRAARAFKQNKNGASMDYVIQVLSAILVGTAIGAIIGPRTRSLFIGSVAAIALGTVALVTASWVSLAIGTAIFLAAQSLQRDNYPARV
jgi:hypothetical protein